MGDCAEYATAEGTRVLPYIAPLMTAARAIARTLNGQPTAIELKPAPVMVKTPSCPRALLPPPIAANGRWHVAQNGERTVCRFHDEAGVVQGFGVAPQDSGIRQSLLAELGTVFDAAA